MSLVNIHCFVAHTDLDSVAVDNTGFVHLRQDAKSLLEDDLLVHTEIVPEQQKLGDMAKKVIDAIRSSDYFLLLLTDASVRQPWVNFEIGVAFESLGKNRGVALTDDEIQNRFLIMMPDKHRNRPDFCVSDHKVIIQWDQNVVKPQQVIPLQKQTKKSLPNPMLKIIWPKGIHNQHVRAEIGSKFLEDVFRETDPLKHVLPKSGQFKSQDLELWLKAFAAWSKANLMVLSTRPLRYWFKGDGLYLRERFTRVLRESGSQSSLRRLSIWNSADFINQSRGIPDSVIAKECNRPVGFRYVCPLAKLFDMMCIFVTECHQPSSAACYAFENAIRHRLHSEWDEIFQYVNSYTFKVKFQKNKFMKYALSSADNDKDSEHAKDLYRGAKDETMRGVGMVTLLNGLSVAGAGSIQSLLKTIKKYHDEKCNCKLGKIHLTSVVKKALNIS